MYVNDLAVRHKVNATAFVFCTERNKFKLQSAKRKSLQLKESRKPISNKRAVYSVYAFTLVELILKVKYGRAVNIIGYPCLKIISA